MRQRLVYIDVIRGLCIFVVVYTHVVGFCMQTSVFHGTNIHQFLTSFFLIMFYFISGMMSYKEGMLLSVCSLKQYLAKKIRTLLIPSVIVMGGYSIYVDKTLENMFCPWNLWVTWFTYVLFLISVIFGLVIYVANKFKLHNAKKYLVIFVAVCCYWLSKKGIDAGQYEVSVKLGSILYYLPFFFWGTYCKMEPKILDVIEKRNLLAFIVCVLSILSFAINGVPLFVKNILVILMVYYVAKKYTETAILIETQSWVDRIDRMVVNFFRMLGQYSLEIYFMHFLLLFKLPNQLGYYIESLESDNCWWGNSSISFVELLIVGSVSAVIAVVSIFFAKLIGQIPYMNFLLFGKHH